MSKALGQEVYIDHSSDITIEKTIYKLGIQGIPGTKFQINGDGECVLGVTGIFDFDFENETPISRVSIPGNSNLASYNSSTGIKLIIDYIYEKEDEAE